MAGILIVDDHAGFRAQLRMLLESVGYVVEGEAGDATTAVTAAQQLCPEAVLLDIQLPDHDGFWVAEELRRHRPTPTIVFISSRSSADYGRRLASQGGPFIHKTDLSPARLAECLGSP